MNSSNRKYCLDLVAVNALSERVLARHFEDVNPVIHTRRVAVANQFVEFMAQHGRHAGGRLMLTQDDILAWIHHISRDVTYQYAAHILAVVNHTLVEYVDGGILSANPMADLHAQYGMRGWTGIAQAAQSRDFKRFLRTLQRPTKFPGKVGEHAQVFLTLRRTTGSQCRHIELALAHFSQFLHDRSINAIRSVTPETVRDWMQTQTGDRRTIRGRVQVIHRFFEHLRLSGIVRNNPITRCVLDAVGSPRQSFTPYIYSHGQVSQLLEHANRLPSHPTFRLRPQTVRMILALLYTLGLRIREALDLQIRDVDLEQGTLLIRNTKFNKNRLLPIGPGLADCLEHFLEDRRTVFRPVKMEDPLFVARCCSPVGTATVEHIFHKLLDAAGIAAPSGRPRPRLHDLRHTFAVHRLLRWYEAGVNVQNKLVLLSTYMGHSSIFSTQVYLTATDSLLESANERFYRGFGNSI